MAEMTGRLTSVGTMSGSLSGRGTLTAHMIAPDRVLPPYYEGEYVITPGAESVVMETEDLLMAQDVTINPVPSNYGLITWDGATLTVS